MPFLHPRLHKADRHPKVLADAFIVSVLYSSMTLANRALVFRTIDNNAEALMNVSTEVVCTHESQLSRVQALLIYQTIRVFDGDIRQRAMAEAVMPTLQEWTYSLLELRDTSSSLVLHNEDLTPPVWRVCSRFGFLNSNAKS